jgi:hypothetical protein
MKASAGWTALNATLLLIAPLMLTAAPKEKSSTDKSVQGTVVAATDANLIIRKGKSDVSLEYDAASRKPSTLAAGTPVLIHYRDEKNKHIVTTVEVVEGSLGSNKPQAK